MVKRAVIQWTETAKTQLAALPPKVRKGLLDKADCLQTCEDPRQAHKPLVGPLEGYYRLTYSRYRAVYSVEDEELASGDVLVHIRVRFVAVGKRKEHDKNDIYRIAEKIVKLGLIDLPTEESTGDEND
jgi:mRNA interferase RelE/StbE